MRRRITAHLERFAQDGNILIYCFVNSGVAAFQITLSVVFSAFAGDSARGVSASQITLSALFIAFARDCVVGKLQNLLRFLLTEPKTYVYCKATFYV